MPGEKEKGVLRLKNGQMAVVYKTDDPHWWLGKVHARVCVCSCVDCLVGRLASRSVGRSVGQMVDFSVGDRSCDAVANPFRTAVPCWGQST